MTGRGSRVEGRAHRVDDSPVSEARVFFVAAPVPLPDIAALTDDEGRFTLYAPAPGTYEVACHADGFDPVSLSVDVGAEEGVHVDFELRSPQRDGA
jgi:hypothetical protein